MKNFKKYIAALLIFALALSLCSCSLIDRLKPAPAPVQVAPDLALHVGLRLCGR